jgi:hypothetical protein
MSVVRDSIGVGAGPEGCGEIDYAAACRVVEVSERGYSPDDVFRIR